MTPSRYDEKRTFDATPEPPGEHTLKDVDPMTVPAGTSFVIQQHHATALHHDVRLEMLNEETPVLVSWAVPKGLPRRRGVRHLAIRTEDHPMEYASFSGSIPAGEYGGGEVRIFDRGSYELVDRNEERITFRLDGERLAGRWHLVHTGPRDGRDQWLAIMSEDNRPPSDELPSTSPMLASPASEPFDDPGWVFEPKWDGTRAMAICDERTRLLASDSEDITATYPELARLHDQVVALDAALDGVILTFGEGDPVVYMAFDVIFLDGTTLIDKPLQERRLLLEELIVTSARIHLSPGTYGDGKAIFAAVSDQGLNGIVAKRLASRYEPGRQSPHWLEIVR